MSLTPRELRVVDYYSRHGRDKRIEGPPLIVDALTARTFAGWQLDNELVDIGCGHGRFAPLLPALNIRKYLGIDLAEGQLKHARKTYPDLLFEKEDLYELGARYPGRFAGFACFAVLYFLPRTRIDEALTSIRRCLVPGAVGIFTGWEGSGTKHSVNGNKITEYSPTEFREHLRKAGLELMDLAPLEGHKLYGSIRAK